MNQKLWVSFESPQSGWMSFSLKAGKQDFTVVVSHVPYDSLRELMKSLTALLEREGEAIVKWNGEPVEYDFNFVLRHGAVELKILRYTDHRRRKNTSRLVFSFEASALEVCTAFWRELRDLQTRLERDEFEKNWRREFPRSELQQLTKALRSAKRERRLKASRA
jgi:hypothetical protein